MMAKVQKTYTQAFPGGGHQTAQAGGTAPPQTRAGLRAVRKQRRVRTTDSRHSDPVAPNLLQRGFTAPVPNRKWLIAITAVWTARSAGSVWRPIRFSRLEYRELRPKMSVVFALATTIKRRI